MAITRNLTRIVLKEVAGLPQFDTGHTLEIRRDAGSSLCTATETSDGNYAFTWTAEDSYGYFYVDGSVKTAWGHLWLGEVVGFQNLDGEFEIDAPAVVNNSLYVSGSTTLATSLSGIVRAASGVISAGAGNIVDADISSSAAIAWSKISKAGSNLTDIATRSHTVLSDIGSNTHPQIDSHIADVTGGVHGATPSNTANMIVRRAADGSVSVGAISASGAVKALGDITGFDLHAVGTRFTTPGDTGTLFLGDTQNYARITYGGNLVLHHASSTNGIQINADMLGIGISPSVPLDVNGAALIRGAAVVSGAATISGTAHVTGNTTLDGQVTLADGKYVRNGFSAYGWTGTGAGYTLEQNISGSGKSYLEIDSLRVRGEMDVYELIINQIRATNGSMWISDVAKVESVAGVGDVTITFVDPSTANVQPFAVNDLVMAQVWSNDFSGSASGSVGHTIVRQVQATVTALNAGGNSRAVTVSYTSANHFAQADTVVRVGNLSASARQNSIYLTADDIGNPHIDILAGVTSFSWGANIKARLGNLAGIADTINGVSASGYGLYSQNAFLKGGIVASFGTIGGWGMNATQLSSSSESGGSNGLVTANGIIIHSDGWISAPNFALGTLSSSIAGWNFDGGKLFNGTDIVLDGTNKVISVAAGAVKMFGGVTYGISGSGFQLGSTNQIAGWTFSGSTLFSQVVSGSITSGISFGSDSGTASHHPYINVYGNATGATIMTLGGYLFDGSWHDDVFGQIIRVNGSNLFECYSKVGGTGIVANIAGWNFDAAQFSSVSASGGSDGVLTSAGIRINSNGWISAPNFALGTSTSQIAGWTFNTTTLSNAGARLEASTSLRGLGVQVGGIDRVLVGSFSMSAATDTSIDATATFLTNGGLSGSGGTITGWTITNLAPFTCFSGSAAAVWSSPGSSGNLSQSFSNTGSLAGKTMLLSFTVHSYTGGGTNATSPLIYLDIPGAYWQRQNFRLTIPALNGSYMFTQYVTFLSDFMGLTPAISFYGQTNGANDLKVVIGPLSLKSYPDTFIFANEMGLNIYKSPAEQISVINGVFTVKSPYVEVQGIQSFVNQSMVMFGNKYRMYYSNTGGLMMEENRAGVWTLTAYINDGQNGWLHP